MQRVATHNSPVSSLSPAGNLSWQLPPIPRFLWDTPTAMAGLTEDDLEAAISEWLQIEFPAAEQLKLHAPTSGAAAHSEAEAVPEELASVAEVGNQISRLRNQVGFLRTSLEGAFGDLLRGSDGKRKSFSTDEVEGRVKATLAGIKASDLMKGPANTPFMVRRGTHVSHSNDA